MATGDPLRDFFGSGPAHPVEPGYEGGLDRADGVEKIEMAICLVLGTAKGERVMRPDFGCGIHDYVFATLDTATLNRIESSVRQALVDWEPRIDVVEVEASPEGIDTGKVLIRITYRVRTSNNEYNMVYPFYLTE